MVDTCLTKLIRACLKIQVLLRPDLPTWLRKHGRIALYKLCSASMLYPRCYVLKGITRDDSPKASGGFGDVYKGRHGSKTLCLKVVRLSKITDVKPALQGLAKEGLVWGQLIHPNILPFYGIYYVDERHEQICLVSPWMDNGDLDTYLKQNPCVARTPLIHDIASGLEYLHSESVIHGDIKPANILVNDAGKACIADFGVSSIPVDQTLVYSQTVTTITACSYRWAAPELLEAGCRATLASDVWAFGCICYEILVGKVPFDDCIIDSQIICQLLRGTSPIKPVPITHQDQIDADMWKLVERCCVCVPQDRPSCKAILEELRGTSLTDVNGMNHQAASDQLQFQNEMRKEDASIDLGRVEQILSQLQVCHKFISLETD
ncbi:kinase-like protein [Macrolepiota fuliginosa MF-IS2]|uniref:Kinase-like protein n=1 Tax=Macrolepiota fuliginosa MF-IS2 TaxID=1400762 RepID=A0A9P5XLW0_9AGAR|nr:kinase-like protein [Macrolepiota fuliginosa MF-IS2]